MAPIGDKTQFKDFCEAACLERYSPFHKTLPRSSVQMHWISVRFYEMGDRKNMTRIGY